MSDISWFFVGFGAGLMADIIAGLVSGYRAERRRRRLERRLKERAQNCTVVVQFTSKIPECITREGIVINQN